MTYCDEIPELSDSTLLEVGDVAFLVTFDENGESKLFRGKGVTTSTPSFPISTTEIKDVQTHATVSYTGSWCCSWISDGKKTQFCRS